MRGVGNVGIGVAWTARRMVRRLPISPWPRASRAPAAPPTARPNSARASYWGSVRRALTAASFGNRSAKIFREQALLRQRKRRTRKQIRTGRPPQGRSTRVRVYWLCRRADRRRQFGHGAVRRVGASTNVKRSVATLNSSRRKPAKWGTRAARRTVKNSWKTTWSRDPILQEFCLKPTHHCHRKCPRAAERPTLIIRNGPPLWVHLQLGRLHLLPSAYIE